MDLSELKGIISLMQKSDLTELEIELQEPNIKLRLARPGTALVGGLAPAQAPQQQITSQVQPAAPSTPAKADDGLHSFDSPMVGTFYRSASPEAEPFVAEGTRVDNGQTVCIIEAMKIMNEISADVAGEIVNDETALVDLEVFNGDVQGYYAFAQHDMDDTNSFGVMISTFEHLEEEAPEETETSIYWNHWPTEYTRLRLAAVNVDSEEEEDSQALVFQLNGWFGAHGHPYNW